MADFGFGVFSNNDIGLSQYNFQEGTFTLANAPRPITVNDDDGILDDEASEDGQSHSTYQTTYETLDTSQQLMVGDIDGLGADGHVIQSVYKFNVYNQTTGQSGTVYMLRLYNSTDPTTFSSDWGNGQLGPYYYASDIPISAGDTFTLSQGEWRGQALFADLVPAVPCFVAGTRIATPYGLVAVERLRTGDLVCTKDNGTQPLCWVGQQAVTPMHLRRNPALRPIRIAAGALGLGLPAQDLFVSPQHRIMVASAVSQRMTGAPEVLIAAKHLVGLPGISVVEELDHVTYVHILFETHQLVFAEGALTESLLPRVQALKCMSAAARTEIVALFPMLGYQDCHPAIPARPLLGGRRGRTLALRHRRNGHFLVQVAG